MFFKASIKNKILSATLIIIILIQSVFTISVNANATSTRDYVVKINKQQNCVTIYKRTSSDKLKPVKAMICSTGADTPIGTFPLGEKMRWHTLMGPCYGQYCSRITGGILFHSVWYYRQDPSTISVSAYNKLGTTASHGCVRLTVADAKWIYDNVPSGSDIVIYNSSDPGPLGKPTAAKLTGYTNWDPTDIWSAGNPWNSKVPSITGASNKTVKYGSKFNMMKGVKGKDYSGKSLTKKIKTKILYKGKTVKKINTKKSGIYKITYSITDNIGRIVEKIVKVKVKKAKATPKIIVDKKLYVDAASKITNKYALKVANIKQGGKKLAKKFIDIKIKKVDKDKYTITYKAERESKVAKKTVTVYVVKKENDKPEVDITVPTTESAISVPVTGGAF